MNDYDNTLKTLLTRPGGAVLASLAGISPGASADIRWHNVELPETRGLRVDLLGETSPGILIHIELQRSHDPAMLTRMLEYAICIEKKFGLWPEQFVLYVGNSPLRMATRLKTNSLLFECRMVDIRELDAEPLLSSPHIEDNILAILARFSDARQSVRRILNQIAGTDPARRTLALKELTILGGLRKLESVIGQETRKMPILDDIMDHDLFGPAIRQGLEQGRHEGREEGERHLLSTQVRKRFGPLPQWANKRLLALTLPEVEVVGLRLLDARTLEELLG